MVRLLPPEHKLIWGQDSRLFCSLAYPVPSLINIYGWVNEFLNHFYLTTADIITMYQHRNNNIHKAKTHGGAVRISFDQNARLPGHHTQPWCLGACLARVTGSNQFHLCGAFSVGFGRFWHVGANIPFIYKEPYFFQNEWGGGMVRGPGWPFSTRANIRNASREKILVIFKITKSLCNCKAQRYYYTNITFLYKRQIWILHCFNGKILMIIIVR